MKTLLIATNNKGKIREIQRLFSGVYPRIITMKEAGLDLDVEEDGQTFEENAIKKATEAMKASGMDSLADDSGLCVDALDGAPGIYSARYAGEHGDDEANNKKLLAEMENVADENRGAAFVCSVALCKTDGSVVVGEGRVEGSILRKEMGNNGFGYDPLFWYPPFGCAFGQASAEQKNGVSHRAMALKNLADKL